MADVMRSSSWGNGASDMNLNDLLERQGIDPRRVLVLRHGPTGEPEFNRRLPLIVAEYPKLFDTYQRFQGGKQEKAMASLEGGYIASFLARKSGTALFVGLSRIGGFKEHTYEEFWALPENVLLREFGMRGFREDDGRRVIKGFELSPVETFYSNWIGRMEIRWPPPPIRWWRLAHEKEMPILSISEESRLVPPMPDWNQISMPWSELAALPSSWQAAMRQWRAVYYIFDKVRGRGYVGSAYGSENLLSRWQNYAKTGHGGNVLLKSCSPKNLTFAILQLLSPDLPEKEVRLIESSWKDRLHTREPYGLNAN